MAVYDIATGILYVDNSTLSAFAHCPTKAMVRYGYNVKPEGYTNTPMLVGTAIHKAVERHYEGGTLNDAIEALHEVYYDYALNNVPSDDRYGLPNVEAVVSSWIERNPLHVLPYHVADPQFVEIPFDFRLQVDDPYIHYVGRIDALVEPKVQPAGETKKVLYVLDNKSTGRNDGAFSRQFIIGSQMTGYVWAGQRLFPEYTIAGIWINCISTQVVPNSTRKCPTHRVLYSECGWLHPKHELLGPYLRAPGEVERWRKDAHALATQWKDMLDFQLNILDKPDIDYVPQYGKWVYQGCSRCELLDYCRAGRPANWEWEKDEWIPGDLAERNL